jgi:uncharacterized CHY-type Zn-finger protein
MGKSPEIIKAIDEFSEAAFGIKRTVAQDIKICVACGKPAEHFRDALSRKEYTISGLCQECQDEVFGKEE